MERGILIKDTTLNGNGLYLVKAMWMTKLVKLCSNLGEKGEEI